MVFPGIWEGYGPATVQDVTKGVQEQHSVMLEALVKRADRTKVTPRCYRLAMGERHTQARSASPAAPALCLRVKRAETAIASSSPKLSSRSAFLSDNCPWRGGKCKRKNLSVYSLLSPLLTTLPPST